MTSQESGPSPLLLRNIFNSLQQHVTVIRQDGKIVTFNNAWGQFARENGNPALIGAKTGDNYLDACRVASGPFAGLARQSYEGVTDVLDGTRSTFELVYPCHSTTLERWFVLETRPLTSLRGFALVIHREIDNAKLMRRAVSMRVHEDGLPRRHTLGLTGFNLAPRQKEALRLLVGGRSYREIADSMGITEKTVDYHIGALKRKFRCGRSADLIRVAVQQDLV